MKSSSLRLIDLGIDDPRQYRDSLIHEWYLRQDYVDHLSVFILRETKREEFFFNIHDGELSVKGKKYSVTWLSTPSTCREASDLIVSLRYCSHLNRGYALVQVLKGNGQYERMEY